MDVRVATREDIPVLAEVLTQALEKDPAYRWFFPNPETRRDKMRRLFTLFLEERVPAGLVFTTTARDGVALWRGPHETGDASLWHSLAIMRLLGTAIGRGLQWWWRVERWHWPEPHWALLLLAVDPPSQGRGVGFRLLRPGLERAEAEGCAVYLDTANPHNVGFYRRLGFVVWRTVRLWGGPTVVQMVRQAGRLEKGNGQPVAG